MASIALRGITKTFGDTRVLNRIDLDIADGEFLTLVGPSGCGKSTTLRIIAGLEAQTEGNVEIDGAVVNDVRPSRRDLAMVFQSYALYPHLTVRQNLATPLLLRDLGFWERFPLLGLLVPGRREKLEALGAAVRDAARTLAIEHLLADFYANNPNKHTAVRQAGLLRDWIAYPGDNGLAITQVIYDQIESIVTGDSDDMAALQEEMVEEVSSMLP